MVMVMVYIYTEYDGHGNPIFIYGIIMYIFIYKYIVDYKPSPNRLPMSQFPKKNVK